MYCSYGDLFGFACWRKWCGSPLWKGCIKIISVGA